MRKNPRIGKHPDMFARERVSATQIDEQTADTQAIIDWQDMTPDELRSAAKNGGITDEEHEAMAEYAEQARLDGDIAVLLQDGLSRKLAAALAKGLHEELLELDEDARERRVKPFVDYIREMVWGSLEMSGDRDGFNVRDDSMHDAFQSSLDNDEEIDLDTLTRVAAAESEEAADIIENGKLDEEQLSEVLRDPALYELRRADSGMNAIWSYPCSAIEDERMGTDQDGELGTILFGGEYKHHAWGPVMVAHARGEPTEGLMGRPVDEVVHYPGMTDEDVQAALKELNKEEPYIDVRARDGRRFLNSSSAKDRAEFTVDSFENDFTLHCAFYEGDSIYAIPGDGIGAALVAKVEETGGAELKGPEHDIVYKYSGTNDSVAGASAKGMYVARLKPKDLRKEGATQGICIGREDLGHPEALREGKTQVYSIRTESGKPKFTIEMKKTRNAEGTEWEVAEVKGKANRLAGFEAGKDTFTKPDDLRLVTDFLLSLGYNDDYLKTVRDIAPGIKAMTETGVDPFSPPPKRVRPHRDPRTETRSNPSAAASPAVRRLLAKTRPMGAFGGRK